MTELEQKVRRWMFGVIILVAAILSINFIWPGIYGASGEEKDFDPSRFLTITPVDTTPTPFLPVIDATGGSSTDAPIPTAAIISNQNCTYTYLFFIQHPKIWPAENILVGERTYSKAQALAIMASSDPEPRTDILRQFFAALMNILRGADSEDAEQYIDLASAWLSQHPAGASVTDSDRSAGFEIAFRLEEYNNGVTGPGHCADEPPTPTLSPTPTATATPTATNTPVIQSFPTRTPTRKPTDPPGGGGGDPTNTQVPPTPLPTNTTQPPPPDTPSPTDTEPPPPTNAPTFTPNPGIPLPTVSVP